MPSKKNIIIIIKHANLNAISGRIPSHQRDFLIPYGRGSILHGSGLSLRVELLSPENTIIREQPYRRIGFGISENL